MCDHRQKRGVDERCAEERIAIAASITAVFSFSKPEKFRFVATAQC
jgi:hypothetical protein